MLANHRRRVVFDETAALYDRYRPEYPPEIAADLLKMATVSGDDRILEIGCGTGKATVRFAPYGFPILALEPGEAMAELTKSNCAVCPNVSVQTTMFEDWRLEPRAFKLVYAAMSLHWVHPDVAFMKSATALVPDGVLAVITNRARKSNSELEREIQQAYERVKDVKPLKGYPISLQDEQEAIAERFDASGRFGTVFHARYEHERTFTADEYVMLMETMSDHRIMPPDRREWLYDRLRSAIQRHGGLINIEYQAQLHCAHRK